MRTDTAVAARAVFMARTVRLCANDCLIAVGRGLFGGRGGRFRGLWGSVRLCLGRLRLGLRGVRLLALAPPAPAAARALFRRREVLGERQRDLLDGAELLARLVEKLRRAGRVALRG